MTDFTIDDLLARRGIPTRGTRLVRHDRRVLIEWRKGPALLDHFVSYQRDDNRTPYNQATIAVQFVAMGATNALFVAAHRVVDHWSSVDQPTRRPALYHASSDYAGTYDHGDHRAYDLERLSEMEDLAGRIVIDWGPSTRSWSQWAGAGKAITEIRAGVEEPPFPGFSRFASTVEEVPTLPPSWLGALSSVGGVYLLVCPRTGEQYVGSAYGEDGFTGRWLAYAADGHGGNLTLRTRERADYAVSILEVASPDMAPRDVIEREGAWKTKLGSRAHGLNAN